QGGVDRPQQTRAAQEPDVPLDDADARRRLPVRLVGPAQGPGRAALRRDVNGQGHVERAEPDPLVAPAGRWALRLPERGRRAPPAQDQPEKVRGNLQRVAQGQGRRNAAGGAVLGGADLITWAALRPRRQATGLSGADQAEEVSRAGPLAPSPSRPG